MKTTQETYTSKNDKNIIVRNATECDAATLVALKKGYIRGTTTIPLYEHEYKNTTEQEAKLITKYNTEANSILLVAECDGELIGNIDITGNQRQKLQHTAMLGMGVANNWQNTGVGSCLMNSALKTIAQTVVSIVWLEVYASNIAGLKLYEKFRFEKCGAIKNFFNETAPIDKITMVKYIK
ncbi:GNAT family N-acetyltransferase [Flavobacterium arcticum]|uniref:GNAT family N-acetyltransferase n=1 Tax=Flavobacterium arcticum TaxID=1784713 RepID=A0A345HD22_9FLAO|nr:GNAT family N-acetyltransferase [Flavobacterium arcticum]AXG74482.1 GNAT family N-acetyltransferase [Flavobacterium arcticum]KAF2512396.1 GNAT family N-acetyltransferase [Flavobacterium arcticum]